MNFRIALAGPHVFGRGYGTETTRLVVDFAFDRLRLHRLGLDVAAYNPRAQRVYEKCGFVREGVLRDAVHRDGGWHDSIVMSVLATDRPLPWGVAKHGEAVEYQVGERTVRVSSPDKVYFPERGITKRQVVEYYLAVAEPLLRAIGERPTTLKRFVDGVTGEAFYAKRVPKGAPSWVDSVKITFPSGRTAFEVCPTEPAVVAWAANLGTFDFHPWPVRRADVDHPDELRIDIDPPEAAGFADAVRVAGTLREVLADAGLAGFPKTSGGRGVHVLVRIRPEWTFVETRHAVIAIGREVERRLPELATVAWWKEERHGRVFLDYNQMARDRTVASAWSVRGLPRATVSTPVTWEQLSTVDPDDFDVFTVPDWLAEHGDAHAELDGAAYGLETALEWYARDERDRGLGEMPYPPDYPKMPGEPKRVQPSKARADT